MDGELLWEMGGGMYGADDSLMGKAFGQEGQAVAKEGR